MSKQGMDILKGLLNATAARPADNSSAFLTSHAEAGCHYARGDIESAKQSMRLALAALDAAAVDVGPGAVPPGYATVYGALELYMPHIIRDSEDIVTSCLEDEEVLGELCRAQNVEPVLVQSPSGLFEAGGDVTCWAYPLQVINKHFEDGCGVSLLPKIN